ncbi:uncharacterized protein LOC123517347 isoform X1 [Portunus trituberculatus]|uniref:uncharacterized protein LOC123517347 isoform X1 n=1 Tax=Portunus trituberculatus TaxID=210409 RepID=UPI001E1CF700|nr:uncharacterized protein LOC123517347 isoform X1 [Portunus trituberculatus]
MDLTKFNSVQVTYITLSLIFLIKNACGLKCYVCDSSRDVHCPERLRARHHEPSLSSTSCDHVFEARYCVKTTGLFEGQLGTKRFCSARDWGNYCEWVRRPGDEREYRACVFTCWGNGCNSAPTHSTSSLVVLLLLSAAALLSGTML